MLRDLPMFKAACSLVLIGLLAIDGYQAAACPFCISESQTLTEEIATSSVVLLAHLKEPSVVADEVQGSDIPYGFIDPSTGSAKFSVARVLQGEELVEGIDQIEALYFGKPDLITTYFIRGLGTPPDWNIPMPLSKVATDYVVKLFELPESGGDRLAFFQTYLQHDDTLLSQDAYDEFARASYSDMIELGDRMDRDKLLEWIESPNVSPSRRRLFLTMLGVCGTQQDIDLIEKMISSDIRLLYPCVKACTAASLATNGPWGCSFAPEVLRIAERQRKLSLDATIACYLTLRGKQGEASQGLDLIDERFLKNPHADYTHIYSTLMAIRFLGEEQGELVPKERVLASAHLLLDSPEFADQIIPDLSRWDDWSVLDRLTKLYITSFEPGQKKYVREPIITYLDVASEQSGEIGERAKAALEELEPLDLDAVRRARSLLSFGMLARSREKASDQKATAPTLTNTEDSTIELTDEPTLKPAEESPRPMPLGTPIELDTASTADKTPHGPTPADAASIPYAILLVAPILGATICFGLLWWILRGGTT